MFVLLLVKQQNSRVKKKKWWQSQTLYWQGHPYKRDSDEYQNLLNKAYNALSTNSGFMNALKATNNANLTHSIGKNKPSETVLTSSEFCKRLMYLRDNGAESLPVNKNLEPYKQLELF